MLSSHIGVNHVYGSALHYRLIVANIKSVVASHIHVGPVGVNGPVAAFLFGPVALGGGRTDGVLAEGTIPAANLVGRLAGQPFSALIAAIEAGNTYVNVHTNDGVGQSIPGRVVSPAARFAGRFADCSIINSGLWVFQVR